MFSRCKRKTPGSTRSAEASRSLAGEGRSKPERIPIYLIVDRTQNFSTIVVRLLQCKEQVVCKRATVQGSDDLPPSCPLVATLDLSFLCSVGGLMSKDGACNSCENKSLDV